MLIVSTISKCVKVCPSLTLILTVLLPVSTLRQYVILLTCTPHSTSDCLCPPSESCDWFHFHPKFMLTMVSLLSVFSNYVTIFIASETHAEHVTACLHPQKVSGSFCMLLTIMLTMSLPVSTLRKYVTVSLCCPPSC